jgi:hypoxanthine-DNA glycosylase
MNTSSPNPDARKRCFAPVIDHRTRLLVLGSLPGDKSLAVQEYYGNRQNKFWELLGAVIGADLRAMTYDGRLATLLAHGIGLWDVIAEAGRTGSLDAAIVGAKHNQLLELAETLPNLRAIAFNGGTAARHGRKQLHAAAERFCLVDLPSSSPAHTVGFESKLQMWRKLSPFVLTDRHTLHL